jgi:hypothetical protein
MPGQAKAPIKAPPGTGHQKGTGSSTGSGTAEPAHDVGGGSNGAMQDLLGSNRQVLEQGRTLTFDTGDQIDVAVNTSQLDAVAGLLADQPAAYGALLGGAGRAVAMQQDNDPVAWSGALWELSEGPAGVLDQAMVGADHQLSLVERFFPQVAQDPGFQTLKTRVMASEATARSASALLAHLLTPRQVRGASISGIASPEVDTQTTPTQALARIEARFTSLIQTAMDAEVMGEQKVGTAGYELESRAIDLCAGPLGAYPVQGPEWKYVWESFLSRKPGPALLARINRLLGLSGGSMTTMGTELGLTVTAWGQGRTDGSAPQGPLPASPSTPIAASDATAAASKGTKAKGNAGHKDPKLATHGLDTSKVKGPQPKTGRDHSWDPDQDEADKAKEEADKAANKGKKAPVVDEPAKWGAKGKVTTEAGKVGGGVDVTRNKNPDGTGSDSTFGVEGGMNGERAYGTAGASTTIRTRDAGTDNKSGMDTTVGGKVGTNDKGQLVAQGNVGATVKRTDGSETSWGKTVGTDGNGVQVAQNVGHTTTAANGDKRTTSGGAGYNTGTNEVSLNGGITTKDSKGDVKSSTTASGKVDLNGQDGTQGASGTVGHQAGKVNVVATASWKQELTSPVQEGARWRVDYTEAKAVGGSLGAKGKKGGASAGVTYSSSVSGTRFFKSKTDAERFWKEGDVPDDLETADAARNMEEGETRNTSSGMQADVSGNAQVGMFSVGGGVNFGNQDFENTKRGAKGSLRVEVGGHAFSGWNAAAGAGGVSLGYGESHTDSQSRTIEFDLDTEVGRWAYDHYKQTGRLPPSGRGWREVGEMKGQSDTRAKNLGLLGVAVGQSHTVSHTERQEDGNKIVDDIGIEGSSVSVPLLGSHSEKHGLYMQRINQGPAFYQTETEVTSSSTGDIKRAINRGTDQSLGTAGSNKGTYKIQSVFSQGEIDGFLSRVEQGGNGGTQHSDLSGLRNQLFFVRDPDARRRVMAQWVADNGDDALQAMFDLTRGDRNANFYVEIKGDEFMQGMKGHLDQESHIARWQARLDQGEGGFAIANEVRADLAYQRRRRDALRRYGELPQTLLDKEYERTDQHLVNLQLLESRALSTITELAPNTQVGGETSQVLKAGQMLQRSRAQYARAHRSAQRSRRIHLDGFGRGLGLDDSAYEEFTSERGRYKEADRIFKEGEARELSAKMWESAINTTALGANSAGLVASHTIRAAGEFQAAARLFDQATDVYLEVASRRGGKTSLLDGYQYGYTDGM